MEERGTVIERADGVALVRIDRSAACEGCTLCTLSEAGDHMLARAVDRLGVSVGDKVRVQTRSPSPLAAALLLFLVPFAFLFAGYGAGALLAAALRAPGATQPMGAAGAIVFFVGSFGLLSRVSGNGRGKGPSSVIVEKLQR
ncbi:MAG: SoxR reducing system RseC family protein [Spirochaetia bacterium]